MKVLGVLAVLALFGSKIHCVCVCGDKIMFYSFLVIFFQSVDFDGQVLLSDQYFWFPAIASATYKFTSVRPYVSPSVTHRSQNPLIGIF